MMYEDGFVWSESAPDIKLKVVELLDRNGNTTTDEDLALGGVVEMHPNCFQIFFFSAPVN